jgi:hypothetical protein
MMRARMIAGSIAVSMLAFSLIGVQAVELTFVLRIERGRVADSMRVIRVKQGDVVKLRWSADRAVILHLHGYDIETKVQPDAVAEMAFTARATGRFPVHVHRANERSGHSHDEPPLVRIEVHPR